MSFLHDSTGIDPDQEFPLLPEGQWFPFKIYEAEESVSKKAGYPMILAKCEVVGDDRYAEMNVWHYVVFIPKGKSGDGINVHFRKCIGVPFGGNDDVDADDWVGKRFMGKIVHEVYLGKKNHKIGEVSPMREEGSRPELTAAMNAQTPATPKARPAAAVSKPDKDIPF
jgi:hypothetical protein